jgi:site-specific recombinase XerD
MTTAIVQASTTAIVTGNYAPDHNPALVYLASLGSAESRRAMRKSLDVVAKLVMPGADPESFPWAGLRYQHTQAIRAKLADTTGAPAANRHLSALRGVLKEAWRLGQMDANDYQRAIDLKPVKATTTATQAEKGRHLKQGELAALMGACDDGTKAGVRDSALLALAYTAGLRRAELAGLQLADWHQDDCTLTVKGKGNKTRIVPITESACDALVDWLAIRGNEPGALFTRIRKGDQVTGDGMTTQAIYFIMQERAAQAGVKAFSPHDMRRTFAGDLLDAGADIATVQKLMGHSSVATTAGYDRRDAKAKRAAVNKLHIPYTKRGK